MLVAFAVGKKRSVPLGLFLFWCILSAILVFGISRGAYFERYGLQLYIIFSKDTTYSLCAILCFSFFITNFQVKLKQTLVNILRVIFWLSVIRTLFEYGEIGYYRGAFSGNSSMNGCLIAFLFPFAWQEFRKKTLKIAALLLAAIAIYMTDTSVSLGVFWVVLTAMFVNSPIRFCSWFLLTSGAIGFFFTTKLDFFNSNGRFDTWKILMDYWWQNINHITGSGLGTGINLFSMIQDKAYPHDFEAYLWLHNDWLQILFELGYVGFALAVLSYIHILYRARLDKVIFSSLLGIGACACFNYPLRLPIHAASIAAIIWLALIRRDSMAKKSKPAKKKKGY